MVESDIPAVRELQKRCFPGMTQWSEHDLQNHLKAFPEGQIVVEFEGEVVGSSSSLILDFASYSDQHSFRDITAGGSIKNHDPEGANLYGIEVMVDPEHRDKRLGRRLYEARMEICRRMNLESIVIAGRMPGYGKVAKKMTPREYVDAVRAGELHDPVIGFQLRNGFQVKKIIPDYLPGDVESQGHAALMEWINLDHQPAGKYTRTAQPVRVAVIQYRMREVKDFEDFEHQTEYFIDVAADRKADIAVFPELLTTQLLSHIEEKSPAMAIRTLTQFRDQYIEHFTDLAVRYNVNILGGTHIIEEEGKLYNCAFFFRRDGTIERQEKLHITQNERRWWGVSQGRKLNVFDTDVGRVVIHVGYDIEFPEICRLAAEQGARMMIVPYCTEDRQGHLRVRYCAQARAVENQVYVITTGTVGNLPRSENMDIQYAQSAVLTPSDFTFPRDGIQGETDANVETVLVCDLDLEVLKRTRRSGSVQPLDERRLDLYEVIQK